MQWDTKSGSTKESAPNRDVPLDENMVFEVGGTGSCCRISMVSPLSFVLPVFYTTFEDPFAQNEILSNGHSRHLS